MCPPCARHFILISARNNFIPGLFHGSMCDCMFVITAGAAAVLRVGRQLARVLVERGERRRPLRQRAQRAAHAARRRLRGVCAVAACAHPN